MLYYDRIVISGGIVVNKTSKSKEGNICHYWYFLNKEFKFQPNTCNGRHDLVMMFMNLSDFAIFCCIMSRISKSEAINVMQNINLTKKAEDYKT